MFPEMSTEAWCDNLADLSSESESVMLDEGRTLTDGWNIPTITEIEIIDFECKTPEHWKETCQEQLASVSCGIVLGRLYAGTAEVFVLLHTSNNP